VAAALGTSFARWRAEALGLDNRAAFERICAMRFGLIHLSASWREVAQIGYEHLDSLLGEAERARQPVLVTVGMKALGWPEFYLPDGMRFTRRLDGFMRTATNGWPVPRPANSRPWQPGSGSPVSRASASG
jgi:hypothetical protein